MEDFNDLLLKCENDEHDWALLFDDSDSSFTLYCRRCGIGPRESMKGAYIDGLFIQD